ncbi:xylan 1,4-beta-xylosidase [Pseudoduganella flava]|uniref:Glycoside hydrolase n=1 Tax=Pseudoduganella flava TaxID=871742 RepID=A0A562PZA6_9BURK|nr:glycoside hydrolase [Pseudoduganella flava]QGZ38676.1 glycoside hydrolase [Pseudoduganella flava]TWI49749.1 xylan 1,4-beta-xylosidase [Pseudoduganella flava]
MRFTPLLLGALLLTSSALAQQRTIAVDATAIQGDLNRNFNMVVGAGRANEGLRADWQQQLAEIRRDAGFRYIRMHGLLSDDMGVYKVDAQGREQYNFQYIDALYDYLLSVGVKPFVELGFMPAAMASGEKTIFWWRGNVTPPRSYEKWEKLVKALTQHWTERYGQKEVASWYFEVWNEPNLDGFWAGTQDEYFKLYAHAARAIKSVSADYRVGGPATAGAAWIPETIAYAAKHDVPLDFVSTHTYGVEQGFLDEFGTHGTVLSKDAGSISNDVLKNRREIAASSKPRLPLHYTEWSSSYTPSDPTHDSYHQAAYILQKLKQVGDAAQSMSYWVFTDIFEEAGPRFEAFHGGFGLMNTQGIKKSAYFAYQFLNQLGPKTLANGDEQSIATVDGTGNVAVLLWDYTRTLPDGVNNQQYFIRDLPPRDKGSAQVALRGLKPGTYTLAVSQVGYRKNDAYTAYIGMGAPRQLTRAQVTELKAQATGKPSTLRTVRIGRDGTYTLPLPLRENDVYLVRLTKGGRP